MENNLLELKNLYVNAENKEILKGINLKITKVKYMLLWDQMVLEKQQQQMQF